jgi:hypothetical protein
MKPSTALSLLALLLAACGTRPPMPPECEGPLTPINASTGASNSGAVNAPGRRS